jgi:glutaredoxin
MDFKLPELKGFSIYSKSGCPNCIIVKKLIKEQFFLMTEIDCDEYILEDKISFLTFIQTISGHSHKTFPIVFYDGSFVGGLNETKTFINKLVLSFEDIF